MAWGAHQRKCVRQASSKCRGKTPPIILKLDISGFTLLIPNLWWTHVHNLDRHLENKCLHINIDNTLVIYSLCTHFVKLPEGPNPVTSCAWKNESIILTFSREIVELLVVCICEQAVKVSQTHGDFHPSQTRTPTCLFHDHFPIHIKPRTSCTLQGLSRIVKRQSYMIFSKEISASVRAHLSNPAIESAHWLTAWIFRKLQCPQSFHYT